MFLVVGESLVDLIGEPGSWRFEAVPGGSPLNVAVGLAAAGHPVRLASEIGQDLLGVLVRDHLGRYGVLPDELVATDETSLAFARVDALGTASYDFRFSWTWSGSPAMPDLTCLHTGSLATVVPPGAQAVREIVTAARDQGVPVSYDPNVRPSLMGRHDEAVASIEQLAADADIVKVSAEDLAWLYPGEPEHTAATRLGGHGPGLVVVTRGADGAVALFDGQEIDSPAPQVEVVNTVGAGDAFTSGLLASLASADALAGPTRHAVEEALRRANATAAAVCAQPGGKPPPR